MIFSGRDVVAVLGPTNTGKTHYAIERMVAHESGVIGLPLRLLAREVYERICLKVGRDKVALVTGEEKISPAGARYQVCTVEAMPQQTDAAFVAIDEVQLAGDLERGHVFTDRILNLRGRQETLLLGAGTMRGILEKLLPGLTVISRPRLSHLAYAGAKKITRLPRRSVIVAFSADEVYAIAELIRRQRGGAAVVLGALSPRTRNAQVALYQAGDVEYLVATDAIGMGLNLDVDHVAFAQDQKFDGYQYRKLNPSELGQVAGRAGRHLRDGTFGVTGRVDSFSNDLVERIESHDFAPMKVLQWRSKQFDFSSLTSLQASLDTTPTLPGLTRSLPVVDQQALEHLVRDRDVVDLASTPERVEQLWDVCALPDYRRITPAQHADMISTIYGDIVRSGAIREDYIAEQIRRADRTDGEIDTLSARISQIRTWTYAAHRPGWLANPSHWQEKTREIEDRLSDALHERLTKRFVDRRTSVLMKRLRENAMLEAEIGVDGDVFVEGHHVGQLAGFRFTLDSSAEGPDAKAVLAAAQKSLGLEFEARAARLHASGNSDFALGSDAVLRWMGDPVARLTDSDSILRPRSILLADEQLSAQARDVVVARIERFVNHHISTILKPLDELARAEDLEGLAKGLAFRLVEALGILFRRDVADDVKALDQDARGSLRRYGVRFGAYHIFMPALLKPAPAELITLLWSLRNNGFDKPGYGEITGALAAGRTSIVTDASFEREFYRLSGFRFLGKRAVRVDILERLSDLIRPLLQWKPNGAARPDGAYDGRRFVTTPAMLSILGATPDDIEEILKGLGYRADTVTAEDVSAHLASVDEKILQAEAAKAAEAQAAAVQAEESAAAPAEETSAAAPTAALDTAPEATTAQPEAEPASVVSSADADKTETAPQVPAADAGSTLEAAAVSAAPADGHTSDGQSPEDQAAHVPTSDGQADASDVEAPKPVLLWHPAGRTDNNRGRNRNQQKPNQGAGRGNNRNNSEGDRSGKPQNRPNDRSNDRANDKPRGKGGFKGKSQKPAKGNQFAARPPRKEKPIDPDSPFAKLAALKEQMKK